jgi:hypothetical protein
MISVILPIRNRAQLFELSLQSWAVQTIGKDAFELVVVDQNSSDGLTKLLESHTKDLNVRYFNLDPSKGFVLIPPDMNGWTNPALPQNFGVKRCAGDLIVLTSPETIQTATNLEKISSRLGQLRNAFLYGRVVNTAVKPKDFSYATLAAIPGEVYCGRERPPQREPLAYFLGAMKKEDFIRLGGIEEQFMGGVAYEDTEFGRRVVASGMSCVLDESIIAIHQSHPSACSGPGTSRHSAAIRNACLYQNLNPQRKVGNVGRTWGELRP